VRELEYGLKKSILLQEMPGNKFGASETLKAGKSLQYFNETLSSLWSGATRNEAAAGAGDCLLMRTSTSQVLASSPLESTDAGDTSGPYGHGGDTIEARGQVHTHPHAHPDPTQATYPVPNNTGGTPAIVWA